MISNGTGTATAISYKGPDTTTATNLPITYTSGSPGVCTVDPTGKITVLTSGNCTITARQPGNDSYEAATDVSRTFVVTGPPSITTDSLPNGTYGSSYTTKLAATGGTSPYSKFTLASGTLPAGPTLADDGTISGTPTAATSQPISLEFTVTDSAAVTSVKKLFTITINKVMVTVTAGSYTRT